MRKDDFVHIIIPKNGKKWKYELYEMQNGIKMNTHILKHENDKKKNVYVYKNIMVHNTEWGKLFDFYLLQRLYSKFCNEI